MANEIYGSFEFAPKGYTRGSDIGRGQIGMPHANPPLFLELRLIKSHTHTGVDSMTLPVEATPFMLRGFQTRERIERGTATWAGSAASTGGVALTFGTPFAVAPTVIVTISGVANADVQVTVSAPTTTGVTIYWKDDTAATHTSVTIEYLIIGR